MNVEIGTEAALFPEKEYINGIAVAVCSFCSAANSAFFAEDFSSCSVEDDVDLDKTFRNDATPDPTPQTEKYQ